ncbi:MAG: nucleotidyltransferase domain-containing protein [Candidatus Omnitrophica bacterium]|nr:nucleotidyltransferase domain-containing protein [Candidatus Omnitrophota bacterium]
MQNSKSLKDIKKILLKYKEILKKDNFPVIAMILFGFYAKGNSKPYSDIDVCVISERFLKNKSHYESYLWKKVLEVDPHIEPVGYHPNEFKSIDPLVNEIKKHGIWIN